MLWDTMGWISSSVRLAGLQTDIRKKKRNIEATANYRKSGKRLDAKGVFFSVLSTRFHRVITGHSKKSVS